MSEFCPPGLAPFPPLDAANEDGLLAIGGDLSPARLVYAYSEGIFPWFSDDSEPVMWWSPSPRCVLFPAKLKTSRSLMKSIRSQNFTAAFNRDFAAVIAACAEPRRKSHDTWITDAMREAYLRLHEKGVAHSVEIWQAGKLVGGLYGVALGNTFFGESMFSHVRDASKAALKTLCEQVDGLAMIDCQLPSQHLFSLGAELIERERFVVKMQAGLNQAVKYPGTSDAA